MSGIFSFVSSRIACLLATLLLTGVGQASATTFLVTNTNNGGSGSFRAALKNAEATPGADVIQVAGGVYGTVFLNSELPPIHGDVEIVGSGLLFELFRNNAAGTPAFRILTVRDTATVGITGVSFSNGHFVTPLATDGESGGGGVWNGGTLTLTGLGISDCRSETTAGGTAAHGGGIYNAGTLTLNRVHLGGNEARGGADPVAMSAFGGGIFNSGTLAVGRGSSIALNSATGNGVASTAAGGGIYNLGSLKIDQASLSANSARPFRDAQFQYASLGEAWGGGIANAGAGTVEITRSSLESNSIWGADKQHGAGISHDGAGMVVINSTITANEIGTSQNTVEATGAGIAQWSDAASKLVNCTIIANTLQGANGVNAGGGVAVHGGTISVINTVIARNVAGVAPDVNGAFISEGHNLVGDGTGGTGFVDGGNGDQVGNSAAPTRPRLGQYGQHGGKTMTFKPVPGSPVIDAGSDAVLADPYNLVTDQRGIARKVGSAVDIGAVEFINLQPDAKISRFTPRHFVGAGIYNLTGAGQGQSVTAPHGTTETFFVKITNNGDISQDLKVLNDGSRFWFPNRYDHPPALSYFDVQTGAEITSLVRSGGFRTSELAVGASFLIRIEITIGPDVQPSTRILKIIGSARKDPSAADVVEINLTIPRD